MPFLSYSGYQSMARVLKLERATTDFTFSAEFMAGTWNKILSSRVSDDHMRFMARCAFAQGCRAIDWFMFHDRDCWNDAPVSSHGQKRPSWAVLAETFPLLFGKIKNWNALRPVTDLSIVYDLPAHLHTGIGDPLPCADNDLYVGKPVMAGVQAGAASKEYIGLYRLAEQNGAQAAAVDAVYDASPLYASPLAVLPGSPVVSKAAEAALAAYVRAGNTLAVTGAVPSYYEDGSPCVFLGGLIEGRQALGAGQVIVTKALGQGESEKDDPADIAAFGALMDAAGVVPAVRMGMEKAASWEDWGRPGGGHMRYTQERLLGSAVLQEADGERILFVLNHYPEAHRFTLAFRDGAEKLVCLTEEEDVSVVNGRAEVEIDRKNCQIYRVE